MIENNIPEAETEQKREKPAWLDKLGRFLGGLVLPIGSFAYYRKAGQKSVGTAVLFFVFFTISVSSLTTLTFTISMFSVMGYIRQAYADGTVPEITISNGVAEVDGSQPFIMFNDRSQPGNYTFVATDTSGTITEIDTELYDQGFLLTRTELHVLSQRGDYQVLSLLEIHAMFEKDPIFINAETVSRVWGWLTISFVILLFLWLVFWYTFVRLMFISSIALIFWGIATLIKPGTGYGPAIISGIYAIVPAVYFSYLSNRTGIDMIGIETFLLVIFWMIGYAVSLIDVPFLSDGRPLRSWTALIGLPMLILFVIDIFVVFPSPYGPLILWGITLFTWLALIGVRGFFRFKDANPAPVKVESQQ